MAKGIGKKLTASSWQRLSFEKEFDRLTHYLFRYPAKFHPPIARALVERYTDRENVVLDPFCGSGTLLVEACATGRKSVGVDIDPVVVLVTMAKVHRFNMPHLRRSSATVLSTLSQYERPSVDYQRYMFEDISSHQFEDEIRDFKNHVPAISNILHWFRKYVIVDLARLIATIDKALVPEIHRQLFKIVFASIIRNTSNADPVPVSGLEVTSYMKKRDQAGRAINPFAHFKHALGRALDGCDEFSRKTEPFAEPKVLRADATELAFLPFGKIDAVITSPPYHGAVDYYRRHTLEMYWLGLTRNQEDRLRLLESYIGRPQVPAKHPFVKSPSSLTAIATRWEKKLRAVSEKRANAFRHYIVGMTRFLMNFRGSFRLERPPCSSLGIVVGIMFAFLQPIFSKRFLETISICKRCFGIPSKTDICHIVGITMLISIRNTC